MLFRSVSQSRYVWSNDKIVFRTHNYNTYKSASDFLKSVVKRIKGEDTPEMNTTYLARQFNKKYNNWKEAKKNDKKYEGKTDIYNLDKRGYEELNLDVSMKMIFEITGERLGNSFVWVITMRNKFGKKMEEDPEIKGGLNDITNYLNDEPLSVKEVSIIQEMLLWVQHMYIVVKIIVNRKISKENLIQL